MVHSATPKMFNLFNVGGSWKETEQKVTKVQKEIKTQCWIIIELANLSYVKKDLK